MLLAIAPNFGELIGKQRTPGQKLEAPDLTDLVLGSCCVDHGPNRINLIAGESTFGRMLFYGSNVIGNVNAEDLVIGNVTLNPFGAATHAVECLYGCLRDGLQLILTERSGSRKIPFDNELRH